MNMLNDKLDFFLHYSDAKKKKKKKKKSNLYLFLKSKNLFFFYHSSDQSYSNVLLVKIEEKCHLLRILLHKKLVPIFFKFDF